MAVAGAARLPRLHVSCLHCAAAARWVLDQFPPRLAADHPSAPVEALHDGAGKVVYGKEAVKPLQTTWHRSTREAIKCLRTS